MEIHVNVNTRIESQEASQLIYTVARGITTRIVSSAVDRLAYALVNKMECRLSTKYIDFVHKSLEKTPIF